MTAALDRPVRRVDNRVMQTIGVGLLCIVCSVLLAVRADRVEHAPPAIGSPIAVRSLLFQDSSSGRVTVTDANSGTTLRTLQAGEGSFIRGVVRSLARARRQSGIQGAPVLSLAAYADGRLILSDPATQEAIELVAFGSTNMNEFASLLPRAELSTH